MIRIQAMQGVPIKLGRLGENDCRGICFPELSGLLKMYPDAYVSILNYRPTDPDAYPVNPAYIDIDDGEICWRVQSGDLAFVGKGQCEVIITKYPAISKSYIYDTEILEALDGSGDPPDPWTSWQEDVIENANRAEAAAELLENPGAEAVTLAPGTQATASYDNGTFTFGIPQGQQGRPGDPGAPGKDGDDYVITEDDYAEIADDVVKSQGLQRIVTDATDAADLARGYADGKHLDGTTNAQLSENNAEYYSGRAKDEADRAERIVNAAEQDISDAGDEQVQAIEDKGAEVLDSIPADYTEMSEAIEAAPTEDAAAALLAVLANQTAWVDAVLNVTGDLIDHLPQDEPVQRMAVLLRMGNDRLETICDGVGA